MNPKDASAAVGGFSCDEGNVPKPSFDPELLFMQETIEVLESFDLDTRRRIVRWLVDRCCNGEI